MSWNPSDIPFNEWQTEEKIIPTITLDEHGTPSVTERTVKQRYIHSPLILHSICRPDSHYFQFVDNGRRQDGSVLVRCHHCPCGRQFLPGRDTLEDSKLLPFH